MIPRDTPAGVRVRYIGPALPPDEPPAAEGGLLVVPDEVPQDRDPRECVPVLWDGDDTISWPERSVLAIDEEP